VSLVETLAAAGHGAVATPGGKGQFDVVADGELVFSKHESGRFPEEDEIFRALAARSG
jgi:selT/selW/selH-like putative selenoprotein